jgi:hypothetical protein
VDFVKLTLDKQKEFRTVKLSGNHYGIVVSGNELFFTAEGYTTPLQAANAARKLKKCKDDKPKAKKQKPSVKKADKVENIKSVKLYTESEMAGLTHLRFREVWVILNLKGLYVESTLTKRKVVKYTEEKDKAKTFKSYEEARMMAKTLDSVQAVGHSLKRFFVENTVKIETNSIKEKKQNKIKEELSSFLNDPTPAPKDYKIWEGFW